MTKKTVSLFGDKPVNYLMGQGDRFLAPVIQLITFDEMGHCTRPRVLPR